MARDYAREYARQLQRAHDAGYASERDYKAARQAARDWSDDMSNKAETEYRASFTPEQVAQYNAAFTDFDWNAYGSDREARTAFMDELRYFYVDLMGYYTNEEFDELYKDD